MKSMKSVLSVLLIAVMAAMLPLDTDVSLAKRKTPPSKVYGLKLVKSTKRSITIGWKKARRAKKYIIYRSKGSKGRFVKRAVTRRMRFTDYRVKSGIVYRYFIRGYNGKVGRRSRIIKVRVRRTRYFLKRWNIGGNGKKFYDPDRPGASNVTATLYKNGVFKIEGKGNTASFYEHKSGITVGAPWETSKINGTSCEKLIRYVYIGKKVRATNISNWFSRCKNLKKINRLPETVKEMDNTFLGCKNLYKSPLIPKSVKYMNNSFYESGLKKPPVLPEGVRDLDYIFGLCNYITEAPKIPKSAENLEGMFFCCYNLRKAADIRAGNHIKNANGIYSYCKNLTGKIFIRGAIKKAADVRWFFSYATIKPRAKLKVMYSSSAGADVKETVDRLIATKSPDSNIVKEMF